MRHDYVTVGAIVISCLFSFTLVWLASRDGGK